MNIVIGNANVTKLIQTNTVAREIGEALFPGLLFRAAAHRELWEAAAGQTMDFLVPGLMAPDPTPRTPGVTKPYLTQDYERYRATLRPYGNPTQVNMPNNYVTATSLYLAKMHALGLQAARTLNRLPRNELYRRYSQGHCLVDTVAGVTVRVSSLNGFREAFDPATGSPIPVSNVNPISLLFNGVPTASVVIAAVPDDATWPDGPGTLTLDVAIGGLAPNDRLDTADASIIIRPNNVPSVDGINAGDVLDMGLIGQAITSLRKDSIRGCGDGYYHIHFDPDGENSAFEDNRLQRQIESLGLDNDPYLSYSIGRARGSTFFSNNETPTEGTVSHFVQSRPTGAALAMGSGEVGSELVNASGVPIMKTIVIGGDALIEKYANETAFMSEAGVAGRIGGMMLENGRVEIPVDGIRFITKAPSDVYNELVELAWSITADWVCPTNLLSGRTAARYKRARVIETAFV
jgi:hypothetical protein